MRKFVCVFLLLYALQLPQALLDAQKSGWCGYALIEGLPLLSNQLAPFEAITPDKSATVNPAALFQYRFALDHSQVIVEGCWKTDPTRDLVVSLLSQTVRYDPKVMGDELAAAIEESVTKGTQITTGDVVRDYVDGQLLYSIFAPGGTREESAASARAYIADHVKEWEPPDS